MIVRIVRTPRLIDALLSRTKQQVLAATLLQPERRWYLHELARHLRVRPSSLQRELQALTQVGILKRHQNGNRVYFQAEAACPIYPELASLLTKTVGVVDFLQEVLEPVRDRIDIALVYGSVASYSERSDSDVDLMIVGDVPLSDVSPMLRKAETRLGRSVNPTVYRPDEFSRRLSRGDHFLTNALRGEPLFVIGGKNELANFAAGAAREKASDEPAGDQRSSRRR